jgi:glycine/D-amino acid oxidase-like deaminating enzyme
MDKMGDQRQDIVVIGAGIIGVSIAYHLACRGVQVTVLDKQEPGSGCTQGAFAMLIASHSSGPSELNDLYGLAVAEWKQLQVQLDMSLPIQWGGVVNWAAPGQQTEDLIAAHERLRSWDVKVHDVAENNIKGLIPGIVPGAFGVGRFLPDHGAVDVHKAFTILVERTKALGVTFRTPVEVQGIEISTSGRPTLLLRDNEVKIETEKVVIAAGAGTPSLVKTLGTNIALNIVSGTLAYSKPMPPILDRVVNGPQGSIRQNPDGRIVTGLDYAPGADGHDASAAYGQILLARAAEVVPALASAELDIVTIGHVPIPIDSCPVVGFCDTARTVYVATMMSGITLAPLMGRLAATEILGQSLSLLQPYRPGRFCKQASL